MQRETRRLADPGWLLIPLLLSIYILTYQGAFQADDEHIFAARAQSLALRADLEAPQVYGNARVRQLELWGDPATEVEPALSVIGAVLYGLAMRLNLGGIQFMFTANLFAVAGSAYLVFRTCRLLSLDARFALITGLGFGLTTFAMPYALTFYRDPLAMLLASLAFYGLALLLPADPKKKTVGVFWIGIGVIVGALAKNSVLAVIPALMVGLLIYTRRQVKNFLGGPAKILLAGLVALLALSLLLPPTGILARFSAGYYLDLATHFLSNLSIDTFIALIGPWFSPAKSIFLFAPMLLLALIPAPLNKEQRTFQVAAFAFALLITLAQALFYGADWYGGYGWGLRFMLPALPALAVVAGFTLQRWWLANSWRKLTILVLLAAGFVLQQAASWVPWRWSYQQMRAAGIDPLSNASVWSLKSFSPFWQLTGLFSWSTYDTAWLRLLWQDQPQALLIPIFSLIMSLAILLVLMLDQSGIRSRALGGVKMGLLITALSGPFLGIGLLRGDPALADDNEHFRVGLAVLNTEVSEDEAIVMDAYGTSLWHFMMNRWNSSAVWYSLPYEVPSADELAGANSQPAADSVDLFNRLLSNHEKIYYLTTSEVPDFSLGREILWLEANARQLTVRKFEGEPALYIYSYKFD